MTMMMMPSKLLLWLLALVTGKHTLGVVEAASSSLRRKQGGSGAGKQRQTGRDAPTASPSSSSIVHYTAPHKNGTVRLIYVPPAEASDHSRPLVPVPTPFSSTNASQPSSAARPTASTSPPPPPHPLGPGAPNDCFYLDAESCRAAAQQLGLQIGGGGYPFRAPYVYYRGCTYYDPTSPSPWAGRAYFGTQGTVAQMQSPRPADPGATRLHCGTVLATETKTATATETTAFPTQTPTTNSCTCKTDVSYRDDGVLDVSFDMCNAQPQPGDWIGVYPCDAETTTTLLADDEEDWDTDERDAFATMGYHYYYNQDEDEVVYVNEEPVWFGFTCSDENQCHWPSRGTVSFDSSDAASLGWADGTTTTTLTPGCHKVLLNREVTIRSGGGPPYPTICKDWNQADTFFVLEDEYY